jgi:hypothetical protein
MCCAAPTHVLLCCAVLRHAMLQVFVCFKMLLTSGSSQLAQVDGCLMYVFNIQGYITHMVLYRCVEAGFKGVWGRGSFIHVTPVAEAHLSNASPFQTPLITPNNKLIKPTNKDNFLPG